MLGKLVIIPLIILHSTSVFCQWKRETVTIPKVEITNSRFLQLIDSIFNKEKQCAYYTDSLFFLINIEKSPNDSSCLYLRIESQNNPTVAFGLNPKAFFIYKGHYWIINSKITEELFKQVGEGHNISFLKYEEPKTSNIKHIVIDVYEDDSFSIWQYFYKKGEFYFINGHSYCE